MRKSNSTRAPAGGPRLPETVKACHCIGRQLMQPLAALIPLTRRCPKMGFGMPIDIWLRSPLRPWAEDFLSVSRLKREGFLSPALIRQKWAETVRGERNRQHQLWCVLMFLAWLVEQAIPPMGGRI